MGVYKIKRKMTSQRDKTKNAKALCGKRQEGAVMRQKYDVTGMTCSACSSRVEKCVRCVEGVKDVSVNLLTNSMQVEYEEQ